MIYLKWIKLLTNFYWLRQIYDKIAFKITRFTYSAFGSFSKHRERIQKFRETGNLKHLYVNKLEKTCFAYNGAYSDSKHLAKRTTLDKVLKDRSYEIARDRNYDGYQRALANMVYLFFDSFW